MMDNQSLVSIMMPAYNAELFIQSAIESILSQTYNNWELIIINDGSTDQTENIVKNFDDSRIRYYPQENKGEAAARNLALSKTKGEFVAFLDSDDKYLPDFLEITVSFLSLNPEIDAVFTDGWFINTQDQVLEPLSSQRRGPFGDDLFEPLVRASDVLWTPNLYPEFVEIQLNQIISNLIPTSLLVRTGISLPNCLHLSNGVTWITKQSTIGYTNQI